MNCRTAVFAVVISLASLVRGHAGSDTGPGTYTRIVPANGSVTIHESYLAKIPAIIQLVGDGDTDLDVFVYDQRGRLVASGTGFSDRERVTWSTCPGGSFRIVIRNLGNVYNRCKLTTN